MFLILNTCQRTRSWQKLFVTYGQILKRIKFELLFGQWIWNILYVLLWFCHPWFLSAEIGWQDLIRVQLLKRPSRYIQTRGKKTFQAQYFMEEPFLLKVGLQLKGVNYVYDFDFFPADLKKISIFETLLIVEKIVLKSTYFPERRINRWTLSLKHPCQKLHCSFYVCVWTFSISMQWINV